MKLLDRATSICDSLPRKAVVAIRYVGGVIAATLLLQLLSAIELVPELPGLDLLWTSAAAAMVLGTILAVKNVPKPKKRQRFKAREVVYDESGNCTLVTRERHRYKTSPWRPPKTVVEVKEHHVVASDMVDYRLLTSRGISLIDGENIHYLRRLHWWSHGPKQLSLGLTAVLLLAITVTGLIVFNESLEPIYTVAALALLVVSLLILGWQYFFEWVEWRYRYLIITNLRVILVFRPPFSMTPSGFTARLENLLNVNSHGQVSVSLSKKLDISWSFGTWLQDRFGLGFGVIAAETAADELDQWIRDGVKYVSDPDTVVQLLSSLIDETGHAPETDEEAEYRKSQENLQALQLAWFERALADTGSSASTSADDESLSQQTIEMTSQEER